MENEIVAAVPEAADQAITLAVAAKNAGIAALIAFAVLFATAYKRVGGDEFVFLDWLAANRNRWINGVITLILFSTVSLLVPQISELSNEIGFNLNAAVPLSFGLALATWLSSTTKAVPPKKADQGDV